MHEETYISCEECGSFGVKWFGIIEFGWGVVDVWGIRH